MTFESFCPFHQVTRGMNGWERHERYDDDDGDVLCLCRMRKKTVEVALRGSSSKTNASVDGL